MRQLCLLGLLIFVVVLSSCAAFEDPSQKATENAQSTALWTRVYAYETQQSTIEALRLTADSASIRSTEVASLNEQMTGLQATNAALLRNSNTGGSVFNSSPQTAVGGGQPAGPVPTSQFTTPTMSSNSQYINTTTSLGTDNNGCAVTPQNSFTSDSESVFFVTRALNVEPNVAFGLRVSSSGRVLFSDPNFWISDQSYTDTCIWYEIDQETINFVPGNYTVELLANDVSVTNASFTLVGAETSVTEDAMSETS